LTFWAYFILFSRAERFHSISVASFFQTFYFLPISLYVPLSLSFSLSLNLFNSCLMVIYLLSVNFEVFHLSLFLSLHLHLHLSLSLSFFLSLSYRFLSLTFLILCIRKYFVVFNDFSFHSIKISKSETCRQMIFIFAFLQHLKTLTFTAR
jgi:hypothetical protein